MGCAIDIKFDAVLVLFTTSTEFRGAYSNWNLRPNFYFGAKQDLQELVQIFLPIAEIQCLGSIFRLCPIIFELLSHVSHYGKLAQASNFSQVCICRPQGIPVVGATISATRQIQFLDSLNFTLLAASHIF